MIGRTLGRAMDLVNRVVYRFVNHFSRARLDPAIDREITRIDALGTDPGTGSAEGREVLSIGAGGRLGARVRRIRTARVRELDNDPARKPDILADLCAMPELADASIDAIFVLEVLEHVPEPAAAMAEMRRVLKPGGTILASTPFLFEIHQAPHDYYRYTRHGLAHLFSGFEAVEITARNGYVFAVLVPAMRLIMSPYRSDMVIGWLICGLVLVLWPVFWLLDLAVRSDAVTSGYVVRARKPGAHAETG